MRKLSNEITGNSLIGEIAPFSFPLASGGEELKEAALVYIPDLVTKVTQCWMTMRGNNVHVNVQEVYAYYSNFLYSTQSWHDGEIWRKLGEEKEGGSLKMTFQTMSPILTLFKTHACFVVLKPVIP